MASPKASPAEMQAYVASLPSTYQAIRDGATSAQLAAMRQSTDPKMRAVGDAYYHFFSPEGVDHRLEAEVAEDGGLVVTRGRHRVEAAQELGVPMLPVHVRAPDRDQLDALARTYQSELPDRDAAIVEAEHRLNAQHHATREALRRTATTRELPPRSGQNTTRTRTINRETRDRSRH